MRPALFAQAGFAAYTRVLVYGCFLCYASSHMDDEEVAMRVEDIRRRVLERVTEVVAEGDEEMLSRVLEFSRALLLTLASRPPDGEVDLDGLTLKSGTAARILALHQEYVRELIRRGDLKAAKENGEFQIPLAEVIRFQAKALKRISPASHAHQFLASAEQFPGIRSATVWLSGGPSDTPKAGLQPT